MTITISARAFAQQDTPLNYISNPSFTESGKAPLPGWNQLNTQSPITSSTEGVDTYITVASADLTSVDGVEQTVTIRPEWAKVLLRGYIRVVLQNPGDGAFVGVGLRWVDKAGSTTSVSDAQSWLYTTPGWVEINQLLDVPTGTVGLQIVPTVNHAQATAYFKGLSLTSWISTFKDTFSGSTLDSSRWNISVGPHNVSSDEEEWFSPNAITVANNMLRIRAIQQQNGSLSYESGQVSTIGKFQQLYGIYEFQLKLPVTNGAWPAAYLLPWNDDWPPEIDVEELSGSQPGIVLNTNHYSDEYGRHRSSSVDYSADGIDRTQWHTYTVVWEPGEAAWYLDGTYKGTTGQPFDNASDVPMYITLNLAVGSYGGDPSQSTWPQDDFCREVGVYQRSDLALPLYPEDSQEITLPNNAAILSALTCNPSDSFIKTWSLVEGPAPVKIRFPHSVTTPVTFTAPGMYRFSIKIANGTFSNSAELLVYVNKALGH